MTAQILVIDDEPDFDATIRDIFEPEIERGDYRIEFATNGREALKKLGGASSESIQLLLIDVRMPELDGLSLIEILKERNLPIKIILISAYVSLKEVEEQVNKNPNILEFFTKAEVDLQQLRETVNRFLKPSLVKRRPAGFDYSSLDWETSDFVQRQTGEIRTLMKQTAESIIEIGTRLMEVKEKIGYGNFMAWLEAEFNWSISAAGKFMRVSQKFRLVNFTNLDIAPSALYLLASPSLPDEAREVALKRAEGGESITYTLAKEIQQQYREPEGGRSGKKKKGAGQPSAENSPPRQRATAAPSKPEIVAVRRATENSASPQLPASRSTPAEAETWWKLGGRHYLFCGHPDSPQFRERLPKKVAVTLAFPPGREWQLGHPIKAHSELAFYTRYSDPDPETFQEMVRQYLLISSETDDAAAFAFLPEPSLLVLAHELGCRCFVADPDIGRCAAALSTWNARGGSVEKL